MLRSLAGALFVLALFLAGVVLSTVRVVNVIPLVIGTAFILRDRRWLVRLLGWVLVLLVTGFTALWAYVYSVPGGLTW